MFLWFLRVAWNPVTRPYWMLQAKRTFTKMKKFRGYACSFFMWLSDGNIIEHKHLNQKTPWVFEDKKFNLDKWNERYWELFRIFITTIWDSSFGSYVWRGILLPARTGCSKRSVHSRR